MTCGMTVAPRMPVARRIESVPANDGMKPRAMPLTSCATEKVS